MDTDTTSTMRTRKQRYQQAHYQRAERVWNADHRDKRAHMSLRKNRARDHDAIPSALTSTRFLQHSQTSAASLKSIVEIRTNAGAKRQRLNPKPSPVT